MVTVTIDEIVAAVAEAVPRLGATRLVAVDGPGGAGKSTLAEQLSAACGATLLHTDDFASWDDQFDWWARFEQQVLEPLSAGRVGRYQRYDWTARAMAEWHDVSPPRILIVEGVSSAREAVRDRLSLAIWVETPPKVRLARGLDRDGPQALPMWEQWMSAEDLHFAADRTRNHADVVVDGQRPWE